MALRSLYCHVHVITCCLASHEPSLITHSPGWHPTLTAPNGPPAVTPDPQAWPLPSQAAEWMGSCCPHLIDGKTEAPEHRAQPKVPRWPPVFPGCSQQGGRTRLGLRLLSCGAGWLRPRRRELPIWSLRASSLRARFGTVAPPEGDGDTQGLHYPGSSGQTSLGKLQMVPTFPCPRPLPFPYALGFGVHLGMKVALGRREFQVWKLGRS